MSKKKDTLEVYFCRLDARDDPYTGYSTTGFVRNDGPAELSKELGTLHIFMEQEYLVRVRALQDELEEKYLIFANAILNHTPAEPEDTLYSDGLSKTSYEVAKGEAMKLFPGMEANYYT